MAGRESNAVTGAGGGAGSVSPDTTFVAGDVTEGAGSRSAVSRWAAGARLIRRGPCGRASFLRSSSNAERASAPESIRPPEI